MYLNEYDIHVYIRNATNNSNGTFGTWKIKQLILHSLVFSSQLYLEINNKKEWTHLIKTAHTILV